MNVCLYARVACHDQLALDYQVKVLKAFAEAHSLGVIETATEFGSGISVERPALARVKALAADGKIGAVIIRNTSRLFRDALLYIDFERLMERCGVKIFTLDRLQKLI